MGKIPTSNDAQKSHFTFPESRDNKFLGVSNTKACFRAPPRLPASHWTGCLMGFRVAVLLKPRHLHSTRKEDGGKMERTMGWDGMRKGAFVNFNYLVACLQVWLKSNESCECCALQPRRQPKTVKPRSQITTRDSGRDTHTYIPTLLYRPAENMGDPLLA